MSIFRVLSSLSPYLSFKIKIVLKARSSYRCIWTYKTNSRSFIWYRGGSEFSFSVPWIYRAVSPVVGSSPRYRSTPYGDFMSYPPSSSYISMYFTPIAPDVLALFFSENWISLMWYTTLWYTTLWYTTQIDPYHAYGLASLWLFREFVKSLLTL